MSMHNALPIGKVRVAVIICCLVLILGILGCSYLNDKNTSVLDKDEINNKIDAAETEDLNYSYLSGYIKKYGVGNINTYKINQAETIIKNRFYKELPDRDTLAKEIVSLFLEHFYDNIDLNDKNAVTDAVLECFIASIDDKWAYYRTEDKYLDYSSGLEGGSEFVGIGVRIDISSLEILSVFKDSGAYDAGIERGDVIFGVEDKTIENTAKEDLVNLIRGEVGSTVKITVKRGDNLLEFTVTRKLLRESTVDYYIDENNLGHIRLLQFLATTPSEFREAVDYCKTRNAKALVIDVRNNPGGLLSAVVETIDYLTPDKEGRRIASYTNSGENIVYYTDDGHGVNVPIVVLCNKNTASGAELFSAAMRDYGNDSVLSTLVIGETTYGKGLVQSSFILFDNSALTFTIGYYNPPCDVNFNGVGVIPDIAVEEVPGTDAPFDLAIDKALELASKNDGFTVYIGEAA